MSRSISWIDERAFEQLLGRAVAGPDPTEQKRSRASMLEPSRAQASAAEPPRPRRRLPEGRVDRGGLQKPSKPAHRLAPDRASSGFAARGESASTTRRALEERLPSSIPSSRSFRASPAPRDRSATLAPFRRPKGTMDDGATALLDWLTSELRPDECFICDKEGLALVNRRARLEYLAVVAALVRALEDVEAITGEDRGALSIRLAPGQVMSCVIEPTELGKIAMGWVRSEKTAEARFDAVASALRAAFSFEENEE